jgi:hypothetical protein
MNDKIASLMGTIVAGGTQPTEAIQAVVARQAAFTEGGTQAFLTGAFMIWVASLIVWIFLDVKHEEMASDAEEWPEQGAVAV